MQNVVRQTPTMIVSFHVVSGVPHAEMKKLVMAAKTSPSGRIVTANDRIDSDTNSGPRQCISRKMRAFGQKADDGDGGAEAQQQKPEHPRRGTGAERKSAHALQIARRPKGEQCDRHQRDSADKILRAANPFRHDGFDRRLARRSVHGYSSPKAGFEPVAWITGCLSRKLA